MQQASPDASRDSRNNLQLVNLEIPQKTDWELQHDIANALRWNPFVNEDRVAVSVEQGIVTLKAMSTAAGKNPAARAAQRTAPKACSITAIRGSETDSTDVRSQAQAVPASRNAGIRHDAESL